MKKILSTLLILLAINIQAQTPKPAPQKPQVPDVLQKADYVFEGKVLTSNRYFTKDRRIYISEVVQITNIFKGVGLKLGTINVVTEALTGSAPGGPDSNGITDLVPQCDHCNEPYKIQYIGQSGIFITRVINDKEYNYKWDSIQFDNPVILSQGYRDEGDGIPYCLSCFDGKYATSWGWFNDLPTLYKSIRQFNLKTDFIDRSDIVADSLNKIQQIKAAEIRKKQQEKHKLGIQQLKRRYELMAEHSNNKEYKAVLEKLIKELDDKPTTTAPAKKKSAPVKKAKPKALSGRNP